MKKQNLTSTVRHGTSSGTEENSTYSKTSSNKVSIDCKKKLRNVKSSGTGMIPVLRIRNASMKIRIQLLIPFINFFQHKSVPIAKLAKEAYIIL